MSGGMTPQAKGCAGVVLALALCTCARESTTAAQPTNVGALGGPGAADADDRAPTHGSQLREDPVVSTVVPPTSASSSATAATGMPQAAPASPASERHPQLTNEQILQIARTANAEQIRQAELAHQRAKDRRVQKLAATLIRDRRVEENKGDAVARNGSLIGEPSPQSVKLEEDADRANTALRAQEGAEFDKSYVDAQVSEHQALLDMLTQTLIPSSTSSDLTGYLRDLKASDESELALARALRAELEK
jgi:putative membrane protein